MRRLARDHLFIEQGHGADREAGPRPQRNWQKAGVLEMKKFGGFLLVAFLSSWSASASAASCYPTADAMAYAEKSGIKPLILAGNTARAIAPAGAGMRTIDFAAVVFIDDGAMVFFGNVARVCGPFRLNKKQVMAYLRPA